MKPLILEFQAFGCYAGYEKIDFTELAKQGLFLICGETGSGKTMILDAMTFALYGKSSGHVRDDFESMRCTLADFDASTFVRLTIENNGDEYLFERRLDRKRKNLSASYRLEKKDEAGKYIPLYENTKEKQLTEKALELIGLDYDQFRQVIVLPQGQFEKLLVSNSDEKEKILSSIFGEDKWQKIADKMFEDATERRNLLRNQKEQIQISLQEEDCATISELEERISDKKEELNKLCVEYEAKNYQKEIQTLQNALATAKRFGDLKRAVQREKQYLDGKEKRNLAFDELENGKRAEKIRIHLETQTLLIHNLTQREKALETAKRKESELKNKAENTARLLKEHLGKQTDIEELKVRKASYDEKRKDYEVISDFYEKINQKKAEVESAKQDKEIAQKKYDEITFTISELRKEYENASAHHRETLDLYLDGITGELASTLKDGEPCPVCGSISHPHKAESKSTAVNKDSVDKCKKIVDDKYAQLQETIEKQNIKKNEVDIKLSYMNEREQELVQLNTQFTELQSNMVEGISSLAELNKEIIQIANQIDEYEKLSFKLSENDKSVRDEYAKAVSGVSTAQNELDAAVMDMKKSEDTLESILSSVEFDDLDEAKKAIRSPEELDELQSKIAKYDAELENLKLTIKELTNELCGIDEPDENECNNRLDTINNLIQEYAKEKGILSSNIERLSGKLNTLKKLGDGIEEDIRLAEDDWAFAKRLRGDAGTGLQRYVLGIMFSSVVTAANKMLEFVHDGRYRLFRTDEKAQGSNKRGLELKVYDRFSDNTEGRFVNTLSGGEKFLASLALSIGMSTVAQRGGIKIEALFIDEGFGSLDEKSIGDAMDILSFIQKANGLVGIISHVGLLQDRISTKLIVNKSEGTSHIVETIG